MDVRDENIINKELTSALKDFAMHNQPYMKMSAGADVEGVKSTLSGRTFLHKS
jgi:hypothetical protein